MVVRISCINKDDRLSPYEAITHVGGVNPDGSRWRLPQKQAIKDINAGKYKFYVQVRDKAVNVIIAKSRYGNEYLKTEADGEIPDNLLSLDRCPIT